jgi:hypothetical protein
MYRIGGCEFIRLKGEIKAIPLQAWTSPSGSRSLSLRISSKSARECGRVVRPMHRPLLFPGNIPGTCFY